MYCKNCGQQLNENAKFCPKCGNKVDKIAGENKEKPTKANDIKPGIRGWLVLVAIAVILNPLLNLYNLLTVYFPIFTDGTWELLTNPNFPYYVSGVGGAIIFEFIFHILFLASSLYLLLLFFKNDRRFPKFYIIYLVSVLIYGVIDYAIVLSIPSLAEEAGDSIDLGRNIMVALIWVPYMFKSKLVKVTFVK